MSVEADIRDPKLADEGRLRVEWADRQMPVLARIRERSIRSTTTSLRPDILGELVMPLPPLAAQRDILAALAALDDLAASLQRRLDAVRAARSIFGQHLIDGTVVLTEREAL
jgi:hypothetical protein